MAMAVIGKKNQMEDARGPLLQRRTIAVTVQERVTALSLPRLHLRAFLRRVSVTLQQIPFQAFLQTRRVIRLLPRALALLPRPLHHVKTHQVGMILMAMTVRGTNLWMILGVRNMVTNLLIIRIFMVIMKEQQMITAATCHCKNAMAYIVVSESHM